MKTLLVITPGRKQTTDSIFHLLVAETGQHLASHLCSNYGFAYHDLYAGRPERIKEWTKNFGEFEVKYIDETDISNKELIARNKKWVEEDQKETKP